MGLAVGGLYLGDTGRNAGMDSVRFVSRHIKSMSRSERQKTIRECLVEFHQKGTSEERRKELSDTIVLQTWYLFPYILSSKNFQAGVFEEAIQNMVVNTLKAIQNFNPNKGCKFATYLSGYLKDAISGSIRSTYIVNTPSNIHKEKMRELKKAAEEEGCTVSSIILNGAEDSIEEEEDREESFGYKHEDEEAWTSTYRNPDDLLEVTEDLRAITGVYLEEVDYTTASNFVDAETLEQVLYRNEVISLLECIMEYDGAGVNEHDYDVLNKKEKYVIMYRYGIFGRPRLTLEEVATMFQKMGWEGTKEWIFQIEKKAKNKLRLFLEEYGITDCEFFRAE